MRNESLTIHPLSRTLKAAIAVAAGGAGLLAVLGWPSAALGWGVGAFWNLLNLKLLGSLALLLAQPQGGSRRKLIQLLVLKFGLLYPSGIGLLYFGISSPAPFAAGFTAVLITAAIGLVQAPPKVEQPHA
jgi:hypothetical protein